VSEKLLTTIVAGAALVVLASAACNGTVRAQEPSFATVADSIRRYIREGAFPSAAVAVAKDGKIVYQQGFGWADRERRMPADEHTMYSLASISKPMTATGLMMLVQEQKVDLDAPINRYLGSAKLTSLTGDAEKATVRHVMSHMSGLPLHYEFFYEDEDHAERAMDSAIARYAILVNPPGEVYQYSNLGYGILDEVIARVSGTSYPAFMRERVFLPLDLTRTSVHIAPGLEPYVAQRYWPDGKRIPFYDFDHDGGSAIWSSAHDLVRFGMFHADMGLPDQREILSDATRALMQQPLSPASGNSLGYGLGWAVGSDHGKRRVSHGGGMPGVSTVLHMYPEDRVVVVVLTNQSNNRIGRIAEGLAAAAMPEYSRQLAADREGAPDNGGPADEAPFQPPASLIGTWQGFVRTYEGEVPMGLVVQEDGDIHATIGDQPPTLLNSASFNEATGNLTGRFMATIPTEDARRHAHTVLLNVHLRNGVMSGQASAQTAGGAPYYFALTSYVELRR
jgi:CubicO group peptidase (beta-lactamase class C family)